MTRNEYIKIPLRWFPHDIIDKYKTMDLVDKDGFVYVDIRKGVYGQKQAARIAFDHLVKLLKPHGYYPLRSNPGIWGHETLPTKFTLCVDDFGINYTNPDHAHHLVDNLKKYYTVYIDWGGVNYCGFTLDWNYDKKYVDVSMPGYNKKSLHRFQHPTPKWYQHAPHDWTAPVYDGSRFQYSQTEPDLPTLYPVGTQQFHSTTGTLLYYSWSVDPTMLPALNKIST